MRRVVVAVVATLMALTACQDTEQTGEAARPTASPSSPVTPSPTATHRQAPDPDNGACYAIGFREALAATVEARPTPCARRHTSQTYATGTVDAVVDGHLLAIDSRRVQAQVASACTRRLGSWLGATPRQMRLTVLRPVWFTPSLEDADAGADWYRCDVIALASDKSLVEVRGSLRGALRQQAARDRLGICGTARPGSASFERVACSERHAWRAVASYDIPGRSYPKADALNRAASGCADIVGDRSDDPLTFEWGYDYPTQEQWRAGQHHGLCWAVD